MSALKNLIDTIETTGGLVRYSDGIVAPAADESWIDLAEVVLQAKEELDAQGESVKLTITDVDYSSKDA